MKAMALLVSCEHGGNRVPARYRALFAPHADLLNSHRGYDPGALRMARYLARAWSAPLHASETTRLLVELNRSIGHPRLFSDVTRSLPTSERQKILDSYYRPYREAVEQEIASTLRADGKLLHISVHTFTPVLDGKERTADIGLLYDPVRAGERQLAAAWAQALRRVDPSLRVRKNYPYLGKADGFTTFLRRRFPRGYCGIELEINQALATGPDWRSLSESIARTLPAVSG